MPKFTKSTPVPATPPRSGNGTGNGSGPKLPANLAKDLLDELCTVKPGLTVGIEYDKDVAIKAFNKWGEKHGIKYQTI